MVAFVLGNGVSRQAFDIDYLKRRGAVFACNAVYRTHTVDVLVATDLPIATEIQKSGYSKSNEFYTRRPLPELGARSLPKEIFGFSSGPIAAGLAARKNHRRIYLLGFDMGPTVEGKFNNIYADTQFYKPSHAPQTYTGNWIKQLSQVMNERPQVEFFRVCGETTQMSEELENVKNLKNIDSDTFQIRINTGKDL